MSKFTGQGGSVKRNGLVIGAVKQWQASQSPGEVSGATLWTFSFDMYLDTELGITLQTGDRFDVVLDPGRLAGWDMDLPNSKVEGVSMTTSRIASTLTVQMTCTKANAVIAA